MKKLFGSIYYLTFVRFSKLFSRKNLNKFLINSIKKYNSSDKTILNIGAGGKIDSILRKNTVKFQSIDIDPKRKPDYVLSIEDLNTIKENSIDIIFCIEVLEHVQNPFKAIEEIKRVLKKGGVIIASTPFLHPIHDEPYDFYRYTKYGIEHMFKDFKKIHLKERNSYLENVIVMILRLFNIGNNKQKLISILLFPINLILILILLILSPFVSNFQATTGYIYIFKKK